MRITVLANPKKFLDLSQVLIPWMFGLTVLLLAVGLYWGLFLTPPDYQQGESVKIMFVHVPAAWMGIFVYAVMAGASLTGLVFRHPLADVAAKSAAPSGRGLHRAGAFDRLAVGTADVGHLLAMGRRAARLRADPALHLSRLHRAVERDRRPGPRRQGRRHPVAGGRRRCADHPFLGRLVEHAASAGERRSGPAGQRSTRVFLWPLFIMVMGYQCCSSGCGSLRMQTEIFERRARSLMLAKGA